MNTVTFSAAKAVFSPFPAPADAAVNQYGFYYALDLSDYAADSEALTGGLTLDRVVVRLTARNVYRLYVNGEIVMHGPARTAHGYARVDEVDVTEHLIDGVNHVAVEVMAYGAACEGYNRYSNDSTLEGGLFIAEILSGDTVLAATGRDAFLVCPILARAPRSERISHCRECIEVYTLDDDYYLWKLGLGDFAEAIPLAEEPVYLTHEALMPTLEVYPFSDLLGFGACRMSDEQAPSPHFFEANSPYYASLPEHPAAECRRTVEDPDGSVHGEYGSDGLLLTPAADTRDYYATWDGGESRVGFIRLAITCEKAGTIDLVHSELMHPDGSFHYDYNVVTRLHVPAGLTEFVAMEPALARYMMVYFRGVGTVTVHELSILDDAYPDEHRSTFLCSNDDVNRLYKAAKKTLLLNTLDIFMDCPDRERGGWLCDSLWTARAAALMLSDTRVEREFLENFLLTPADGMFHAFFPEVYPALKPSYKDMTGITTWSFWLLCEVCEFIRRTGDIAFREEHRARVAAFVEGSKHFLGKSGLLEDLPWLFIDWSLSNQFDYCQPISTAANSLYAYMLISLGETFDEPAWVAEGQRIRGLLRAAIQGAGQVKDIKYVPDSLELGDDGKLRIRGKYTEAAMCTSLWSGLFTAEEAPMLAAALRDKMGPAPLYAKDPQVGGSQLFIGLCIRLDMLCRHGAHNKMYEDMLAIYQPQLTEGPGTLWENQALDTSSRCHGFTAHAGVHLMRDVLGLDIPVYDNAGEGERILTVAPHLCGLRWARGTHETPDGLVSVHWQYDGQSFRLTVSLPKGLDCRVVLPRQVRMLDEDKVSVTVRAY